MLGFRARNEHIRRNSKWKTIELGGASDVLDRLTKVSAFDPFHVLRSLLAGEFFFRMSHQPCFVFSEQIEEQNLGILPDSFRVRPHAEAHRAL
jgi:hypothetical protein